MTRRDLLQRIVVGGSTIIIVPSLLSACKKDDPPAPENNSSNNTGNNTGGNTSGNTGGSTSNKLTIDLTNSSYAALNSTGGSVIIQNIIVINIGGSFVALSSICTHQCCTVEYNGSSSNIQCPCHGSVFSTSGSVLNGPASTALKSYPVSKSGDVLTITL